MLCPTKLLGPPQTLYVCGWVAGWQGGGGNRPLLGAGNADHPPGCFWPLPMSPVMVFGKKDPIAWAEKQVFQSGLCSAHPPQPSTGSQFLCFLIHTLPASGPSPRPHLDFENKKGKVLETHRGTLSLSFLPSSLSLPLCLLSAFLSFLLPLSPFLFVWPGLAPLSSWPELLWFK